MNPVMRRLQCRLQKISAPSVFSVSLWLKFCTPLCRKSLRPLRFRIIVIENSNTRTYSRLSRSGICYADSMNASAQLPTPPALTVPRRLRWPDGQKTFALPIYNSNKAFDPPLSSPAHTIRIMSSIQNTTISNRQINLLPEKNSPVSILYRYRGVNLCQLTIPAPSRRHPFTILFPYFSFAFSPIPAATERAVARHSFVPFVSLWSNILRSPNSVVNKFQARLGSAKAVVKDDATSDSQ